MSDELNPAVPDSATAEGPETESEETVKQRKNGLYPGVSDELAESMRSGWADTELRDLAPIEQAGHTARRRAALSARFPGERLVIPADAAAAGKLAARYVSGELGVLRVRAQEGATIFDFGTWRSSVASRKNDDGTVSFIAIDPGVPGFNFVVGERDGKRALIVRDAQHEYAFVESAP